MTGTALGLDTSNYTTSAAVFDGRDGSNAGRLLDVRPGELGLRQSDALFQHTKRLPRMLEQLAGQGLLQNLAAVGASTAPRRVEGSYMPCFLVGSSQGQSLSAALGVSFYAFSHQEGHLAAAAWSAGHMELLEQPFLAWHLSGGTTELLHVEPEGEAWKCEILGGTSDISAGQLIDRTGVLLGLAFPAGKALDELYDPEGGAHPFRVKLQELTFSLSGMENQVKAMAQRGEPQGRIAQFTLDTVTDVVLRATQEAQRRFPGLPVLCSGGVASNRRLRSVLQERCDAWFAQPKYSTDNALGIALLTWRAMERREHL